MAHSSLPPPPVPQAIALETDNDRRPDEVVVVVSSQSIAAELANSLNLQLLESRASNLLAGELAHFRIPDTRSVPAIVAALSFRADVQLAAPNHIYRLQSDSSQAQYAVKLIRFTEVDDTNKGQGVRIGVVDTALDQEHPALRGLAIEAFDALKGAPVKQVRHGTAIAGLIGGRKNVRGLAPSAKILSTRAFDGQTPDSVTSDARTLIEALDWLAEKDAQLINLSFAGSPNVLLRRALAAARQRGIVLVAAAGNGGPKARALYPGAYPTTIAVTATDQKSEIYDRANRGDYVFLAAPGVDLLVPTGNSGYDVMSGTSFAAAIVTGLAALRLQRVGKAPAQSVAANLEKVLQLSASDLGPKGRDRIFGYGLIDAARLMQK
ncbi:MAG: S8 family serine peptidase [Pseudomonadota bacterium]